MAVGLKYDTDKLRWDLLPIECVEDIVKILTFGARKYAPNNWQSLENAEERFYAAALRHLTAWRKGETTDPESGLPHLSHLLCNATFLLWFEKERVKQALTLNKGVNTTSNTNAPHLKGTGTAVPYVVNEFTNQC